MLENIPNDEFNNKFPDYSPPRDRKYWRNRFQEYPRHCSPRALTIPRISFERHWTQLDVYPSESAPPSQRRLTGTRCAFVPRIGGGCLRRVPEIKERLARLYRCHSFHEERSGEEQGGRVGGVWSYTWTRKRGRYSMVQKYGSNGGGFFYFFIWGWISDSVEERIGRRVLI